MDYQAIEEAVSAGYKQATARYRRDDEFEVTTQNHRHLGNILRRICLSFDDSIDVLDVGCGTGRYFHCLRNVDQLVGIDISHEMMIAAREPVRANEVTAKRIELKQSNVYLTSFPRHSFDFIYSLGMFGHGPVTLKICNSFYSWLKPGGKLFFNTVDTAGVPALYRARKNLRKIVYPILPPPLRKVLDERAQRWPFFSQTQEELESLMLETQFEDFSVTSYLCETALWRGRHLECIANKAIGAK
jgi:SAM-dependent methyltransferase